MQYHSATSLCGYAADSSRHFCNEIGGYIIIFTVKTLPAAVERWCDFSQFTDFHLTVVLCCCCCCPIILHRNVQLSAGFNTILIRVRHRTRYTAHYTKPRIYIYRSYKATSIQYIIILLCARTLLTDFRSTVVAMIWLVPCVLWWTLLI